MHVVCKYAAFAAAATVVLCAKEMKESERERGRDQCGKSSIDSARNLRSSRSLKLIDVSRATRYRRGTKGFPSRAFRRYSFPRVNGRGREHESRNKVENRCNREGRIERFVILFR